VAEHHTQTHEVWVLLGHFKRKPSELVGVYEHYQRGKECLDGLGMIGVYNEVELKRVTVNTERRFKPKKVKS
jgi:hypothetical protein